MDFSKALELLKNGKRIKRTGWLDTKQYLIIATNIRYQRYDRMIDETLSHVSKVEGESIMCVGYIGAQIGWAANSDDLLANDWKVI